MRVRRLIGTALFVGIATLGRGGAAFAQAQGSSGSSVSAHHRAARCEHAAARLARRNDHKTRLDARIAELEGSLQAAVDSNDEVRVVKLQALISRMQAAHDRVVYAIDGIYLRCGI